MKMEGFVVLTLAFRQAEDRWLARCEELSTSTFGDTFEQAQEAIIEAVGLHLNTLEDVGETRRFFREHKIRFYRVKPPQRSTTKIPVDKHIVYQRIAQPVFQPARVNGRTTSRHFGETAHKASCQRRLGNQEKG